MMQSSRIMSRQTSFSARKTAGKTRADLEKEERGLEAEAQMGRHIEQCESLLPALVFQR